MQLPRRLIVAATGFAVAPAAAVAELPTKPVVPVVPFAPGGPTDAMARTLAAAVRDSLPQPVD
ncbi:MAG: hypothetical protein HS128_22305 [Ideonella sp.]|nr:hypothetical protein [Ideonella sp.]MCC7457154.1 hypothetical protein [Nitrospira sp.]